MEWTPPKRSSRLFGRHRHSQSVGDMDAHIISSTAPPQLPPLNFNFVSGAPSAPEKHHHVDLPSKQTAAAGGGKHKKSPSLMDLFRKKDIKPEPGFTIMSDDPSDDDDVDASYLAHPSNYATTVNSQATAFHHRIFSPLTHGPQDNSATLIEPKVLLPSPLITSKNEQACASYDDDEPTTTLDDAVSAVLSNKENSLPRSGRADLNKALPPINTDLDIPEDLAAEISLYTPRAYTASGQRNFSVTPGLRSPPSRPNSVYLQPGERKTSWGTVMSAGRRESIMETAADTRTTVSGDQGSTSGGRSLLSRSRVNSKRVHPAALEGLSNSTYAINREFSELLKNYGLPQNIKSGASGITAQVKAMLLKSSKTMSSVPLPPPSREGPGDNPANNTDWSTMPPPPPPPRRRDTQGQQTGGSPRREKLRRPFSVIGAVLSRGVERVRPRGNTHSVIGLPRPGGDDRVRPRTTVSEMPLRQSKYGSSVPTTPTSPTAAFNPAVGPLHANSPTDFVEYFTGIGYEAVDLGWLRRLRLLLRAERLAWVEAFFEQDGLDRLVDLIKNIYELEYHDLKSGDVLKEVFLCLKAAYTAPMADARFDAMHEELFPLVLSMMFDDERKKTPHEYETREAAIGLLFTYLVQAPLDQQAARARIVMKHLENPPVAKSQLGPAWVEALKQPRPFTRWSSEVARLTYETGWVWYHPGNRIALREDVDESAPYNVAYFPTPRPFVAVDGANVGSVEHNVANLSALHLEILNAITAYLPTRAERNAFREAVKKSGMEKTMGQVLRCAGKGEGYELYIALHSALTDWVTAAQADGWESWEHVRTGRFPPERSGSGGKVRALKKIEAMYGPQYELPDMGLQDTVAARKRMSLQAGEEAAFRVGDGGGVVLEWEF
ncbi:hypothetical protein TWF696_007803 [Orbilia brochopaga]|uniref:Formin GTPase-binding domain-containing protein n=1 Tax=Orbilia brochopaga TaxID=3140254 RepID=A0AAV9ULM4_9PEZI